MQQAALAVVPGRDRWIVVVALLVITALALGYTFWLATGFDMSGMMSPDYVPWSPAYFTFMLVMWIVMMIGMMTPSVAPTILLYAALVRQTMARQDATRGNVFAPPGWFLAGYLLAWAAFSLLATLLQWWLESRALITPMMAGTSDLLGGMILVVAGVYQWLPLKQACLTSCTSPLSFVQRHGGFQAGARGSLRLGLLHGFYCIGCCWTLMLLLFAFGVMNLTWIAGLMIYVLLEKVLPWPRAVSLTAGLAAAVAGFALMA
jgi:predicted metal-binding membrane protein